MCWKKRGGILWIRNWALWPTDPRPRKTGVASTDWHCTPSALMERLPSSHCPVTRDLWKKPPNWSRQSLLPPSHLSPLCSRMQALPSLYGVQPFSSTPLLLGWISKSSTRCIRADNRGLGPIFQPHWGHSSFRFLPGNLPGLAQVPSQPRALAKRLFPQPGNSFSPPCHSPPLCPLFSWSQPVLSLSSLSHISHNNT